MHAGSTVRTIAGAMVVAAATLMPQPAIASAVTAIDEFIITRSGLTGSQLGTYESQLVFYRDSFTDGNPPPSGGTFSNGASGTYNVLGTYPINAESGGKLNLDSSLGGSFVNAGGAGRTQQRSILPTSADPTTDAGLKQIHTFAVYGIFDLILPPTPSDGYGIFLNDAGPTGATETVDLLVRREGNNSVVIRFQEQDFLNGVVNTLELDALSPPVGASQIEFRLQRGALNTDEVTAAYRFWTGGTPGAFTVMSNSASFFTTNSWARGGFFAVQALAVPEPNTLPLLVLGAAILFTRIPRRGREPVRRSGSTTTSRSSISA